MAKYHDWTFGDAEALINVLGGSGIARQIKNKERSFTVGELVSPAWPARPPLTGKVVKTIVIPAYSAADFAEAVRLGNFDRADALGDIIRQFAKEPVGLTKSTKVDMVEFNRNWWNDEAIAWGKENGNKPPIRTTHTMGIAIKLSNEQRERPIVALGSVQRGGVLCLSGDSVWRNLLRASVDSVWYRYCLVGFLSE